MSTYILLLVAVCGAGILSEVGAYNECDKKILDIIKTVVWNDKNTPKDIIKTAKKNGKEVVLATSEGYYPKNIDCVSSTFTDDKIEITLVPSEGKPEKKEVPIKEEKGVLVTESDGTKVYRYHVYLDKGVTAFYTCSKKCGSGLTKWPWLAQVVGGFRKPNVDLEMILRCYNL